MQPPTLAARAIPAPSQVETTAIEETIRYLRRVGAQVGTLMLVAGGAEEQAIMDTLRGGSLSCASFCEQMLELGQMQQQLNARRGRAART
ncbi:MAG: hypothetical protein ACKOWF_04480 [Chloroflexota bacterium]